MTLLLFDIDGTLTATTASDAKCYATAFEHVFGLPLPTTDWHHYVHVTDSSIIDETLQRAGRAPMTEEDLLTFEEQFLREIQREHSTAPEGFQEIPGAKSLLDILAAIPDLTVALSTGGMKATATFKLHSIGVDAGAYPASYANDARSRADIARVAMARANANTDDVVYIGDGLWDAVTCSHLGMRFVGITRESDRARLQSAGTSVFLDDYRDQEAFFDALHAATVPTRR